MTRDAFRTLILALAGVTEQPHFDRLSFRTRRIFATLAPDGLGANLLLTLDEQAFRCEVEPEIFRPVPNRWGARGWTQADLTRADEAALLPALRAAWEHGSRR